MLDVTLYLQKQYKYIIIYDVKNVFILDILRVSLY